MMYSDPVTGYPYQREPSAVFGYPRPDHENAERARAALAACTEGYVEIKCFNRAEVECFREFFTPEENARIRYSWFEPAKSRDEPRCQEIVDGQPCGAEYKGTEETLPGVAEMVWQDGGFVYTGHTRIDYDGQSTVMGDNGRPEVWCKAGHRTEAPEGFTVE